jgi:hypothetical protein
MWELICFLTFTQLESSKIHHIKSFQIGDYYNQQNCLDKGDRWESKHWRENNNAECSCVERPDVEQDIPAGV